jgi:cell division protein FtsL
MSAARARGTARRAGWIPAFGWIFLLLGSLLLVTWRQTRGRQLEQALSVVEQKRATAEAERVELARRIEQLRSRSRIVRVARERLGMHLPDDREIIFLPIPTDRPDLDHPAIAAEGGEP